MAGSWSKYLTDDLLDYIMAGTAPGFSAGGDKWIALAKSSSGLADGTMGNEVTAGDYARLHIDGVSRTWSGRLTDGYGGYVPYYTNNQDWYFSATSNWGTVTHVALMNAAAGGNVMIWGNLSQSKSMVAGERLIFVAGEIKISI